MHPSKLILAVMVAASANAASHVQAATKDPQIIGLVKIESHPSVGATIQLQNRRADTGQPNPNQLPITTTTDVNGSFNFRTKAGLKRITVKIGNQTVGTQDFALQPGVKYPIVFDTKDTFAPTAPTEIETSASSSSETSLTLRWKGSTDIGSGVDHYEVSYGNKVLVTVQTNLDITNLSPNSTYVFKIVAVDGAGNRSAVATSQAISTAGNQSLRGVVFDQETVVGIVGAKITVQNGSKIFTATSDSTGAYRVFGLTAGSYDVTAEAPGYMPLLRKAEVSGNITPLSFALQALPTVRLDYIGQKLLSNPVNDLAIDSDRSLLIATQNQGVTFLDQTLLTARANLPIPFVPSLVAVNYRVSTPNTLLPALTIYGASRLVSATTSGLSTGQTVTGLIGLTSVRGGLTYGLSKTSLYVINDKQASVVDLLGKIAGNATALAVDADAIYIATSSNRLYKLSTDTSRGAIVTQSVLLPYTIGSLATVEATRSLVSAEKGTGDVHLLTSDLEEYDSLQLPAGSHITSIVTDRTNPDIQRVWFASGNSIFTYKLTVVGQ